MATPVLALPSDFEVETAAKLSCQAMSEAYLPDDGQALFNVTRKILAAWWEMGSLSEEDMNDPVRSELLGQKLGEATYETCPGTLARYNDANP